MLTFVVMITIGNILFLATAILIAMILIYKYDPDSFHNNYSD